MTPERPTRYERTFGTGWESLDTSEAIRRAYAIGVEETLGERNDDERDRLLEAVESNYARSMVELAYTEGKQEASTASSGSETPEDVWEQLVSDRSQQSEPPTGGREKLPRALDRGTLLDRVDVDSRDALDLPGFLDR